MMHQNNIPVRPDVVLAGVISAAVRSRLQAYAQSTRTCARAPSPEAVRRLRTATRRLLGILDLAVLLLSRGALRRCRKRLRSRLRALSIVRDTDVSRAFIASHTPPNPSLAMYGSGLAEKRRRHASWLRDFLPSGRDHACADTIAYAANHIGGQDDALVAAALAKHLDRSLSRVLRALKRARPEELSSIHRLRITFRRLRYAAEILRPALADFTAGQMNAMHRFHSLMGRIQDLRVIAAGIADFGESRNQVVHSELRPVIAAIETERAQLLSGLKQAADLALEYWLHPPSQLAATQANSIKELKE